MYYIELATKKYLWNTKKKFLYLDYFTILLNRPLDSRELKIILKPIKFYNLETGIKEFQKVIKSKVDRLGGTFNKKDKIEPIHRRTWYLDTEKPFELKSKNFFFRIRQQEKEYQITLKCRHEDRYIAAEYDLTTKKKKYKIKFEEDIIAPYISKFSLSAKYEDKDKPEIENIKELELIFPGLSKSGIINRKLKKVNDFEAKEVVCNIGEIFFENDKDNNIKTDLNFWYQQNNENKDFDKTIPVEGNLPIIVEFTFDYKSIKRECGDKGHFLLEQFQPALTNNAYNFYHALQKEKDIVDLESSTTKTSFAYCNKSVM